MTRTIQSTCPECGGIGFVRNRHITNRRNRKKCIECGGKGEIPVIIQTDERRPLTIQHKSPYVPVQKEWSQQ